MLEQVLIKHNSTSTCYLFEVCKRIYFLFKKGEMKSTKSRRTSTSVFKYTEISTRDFNSILVSTTNHQTSESDTVKIKKRKRNQQQQQQLSQNNNTSENSNNSQEKKPIKLKFEKIKSSNHWQISSSSIEPPPDIDLERHFDNALFNLTEINEIDEVAIEQPNIQTPTLEQISKKPKINTPLAHSVSKVPHTTIELNSEKPKKIKKSSIKKQISNEPAFDFLKGSLYQNQISQSANDLTLNCINRVASPAPPQQSLPPLYQQHQNYSIYTAPHPPLPPPHVQFYYNSPQYYMCPPELLQQQPILHSLINNNNPKRISLNSSTGNIYDSIAAANSLINNFS